MNKNEVSIRQSNKLLRSAMNRKIDSLFSLIMDSSDEFQSSLADTYLSLLDLYITAADKIITPSINTYLAKQSAQKNADAAKFAKMGGSLFLNLRIYRDIVYTRQSRLSRLLGALQLQLYKAYANKNFKKAYV